jgi:hypothetical protein
MAITISLLEKQIGALESQMESLRQAFDLFRGYVNTHLDYIYENMATKTDVYRVESKLDSIGVRLGVVEATQDGMLTAQNVMLIAQNNMSATQDAMAARLDTMEVAQKSILATQNEVRAKQNDTTLRLDTVESTLESVAMLLVRVAQKVGVKDTKEFI